jgi:hypothetical protein
VATGSPLPIIVSDADADAIRQACQLSDGHAFELRLRDRLIHRLSRPKRRLSRIVS